MVRSLRDGKESWLKFNDDEVERHFKEMHFESYDARVWLDDAFLSEMHLTTCQTRTTCATWREPRFTAGLSDCDEMLFHHFVPLVGLGEAPFS